MRAVIANTSNEDSTLSKKIGIFLLYRVFDKSTPPLGWQALFRSADLRAQLELSEKLGILRYLRFANSSFRLKITSCIDIFPSKNIDCMA